MIIRAYSVKCYGYPKDVLMHFFNIHSFHLN